MANVNVVTVVGNTTRDPELRYTSAGLAVCNFSVASNRRWQNRATNEWEEKVSFFDVTVWSDQAQNVAESLRQGDRVVVTGRLEQRSWETETGDKRSKIELVADVVAVSLVVIFFCILRVRRVMM
ncbi:MAG: single-stranded DNA-binding protein [Cytophagia bacterium]|nr:single-stranded DNA-binding protein [Cytophagia bacterium]